MSNLDNTTRKIEIQSSNVYVQGGSEKWGQPSASRYRFNIEGNLVYGSISDMPTSSGIPSNQIDSSTYFIVEVSTKKIEILDDATDEIVEFATSEEIDEVSKYLLKKNAELYHRLAQ